jgi:hypothetical protein
VAYAKAMSGSRNSVRAALAEEQAQSWAAEAVSSARATQIAHLQAKSLIWQGFTFLDFSCAFSDAEGCCREAKSLLVKLGARDHAWDELQMLEAKLASARPRMGREPVHLRRDDLRMLPSATGPCAASNSDPD